MSCDMPLISNIQDHDSWCRHGQHYVQTVNFREHVMYCPDCDLPMERKQVCTYRRSY